MDFLKILACSKNLLKIQNNAVNVWNKRICGMVVYRDIKNIDITSCFFVTYNAPDSLNYDIRVLLSLSANNIISG